MPATVILHVGPYKTGTTALQKALVANADMLARHGVLYPRTGRRGNSHAELAEALFGGDTSHLSELVREVDGWRVALLSCEHLSALAPDGLAKLRDAFPGAEFRIAYSLRRLAHLWPSHWAELVKHGQPISFADYLDRVARGDDRPFHAPILPVRQLARLSNCFGDRALHLSVYDHLRAEEHDLGPAFVDDLLGLGQIAAAFATPQANPSPNEIETAIGFLMNRHLGARTDHRSKRAARTVILDQMSGQPDWLFSLRTALDQPRRVEFGSDHPRVAAEQAAVVSGYGGLISDGLDQYLAPVRLTLPDLDSLTLDAATMAALAAAFDAALAAVQTGGPQL